MHLCIDFVTNFYCKNALDTSFTGKRWIKIKLDGQHPPVKVEIIVAPNNKTVPWFYHMYINPGSK